jgi:hypothetical protein
LSGRPEKISGNGYSAVKQAGMDFGRAAKKIPTCKNAAFIYLEFAGALVET